MSGRLLAAPTGLDIIRRRELWLPEQTAVGRRGFEICDPAFARDHKMVAFKYRLDETQRWLGQLIHAPKGEDLDAPGADGVSWRDQIYLLLSGIIERATQSAANPDGVFVYQHSDEMQGRTWIDQWPETEHCRERWDAFVRFEPPRRDSPQVLENL